MANGCFCRSKDKLRKKPEPGGSRVLGQGLGQNRRSDAYATRRNFRRSRSVDPAHIPTSSGSAKAITKHS